MVLNSLRKFMAEGAGFEPAVGFPTFDFESSALNRTQPPFRVATPNECLQAQHFLNTRVMMVSQEKSRRE
jgi:hypothetical protein